LSSEVGVVATPDDQVSDADGSTPSTPPPAKANCSVRGVGFYLVDLASSGDDGGSPPTPASGALLTAVSLKCTPPREPLPQIQNVGDGTPPSCNRESLEEALDRIMATLPIPARLKWLSTRAQHIALSSTSNTLIDKSRTLPFLSCMCISFFSSRKL